MFRANEFVVAAVLILVAGAFAYGDDCRDRDGDGDVDIDDIVLIRSNLYGPGWEGDLNGDGKSDLYDLVLFKEWACGSPPGPAPLGEMELRIDATGEAFVVNPTGGPVAFAGYQISSASGQLNTAAWTSIASNPFAAWSGDGGALYGNLQDIFAFADFSYQGDAMAEITFNEIPPQMAPSVLPLGPVASGLPPTDLEFLYASTYAVFTGRVISEQIPYGDADMDGDVDLDDFILLKDNFGVGTLWGEGDFDGDQDITLDDFMILKGQFGTGIVPEPATLSLLALGALAAIRRKQ